MDKYNKCGASPRWFALINDTRIDSPRREVKVSVLKSQGKVPREHTLVRDHNSPNDRVLEDKATVDLADGNVFYSKEACDPTTGPDCSAPAKMALTVDDQFELTTVAELSRKDVLSLFDLDKSSRLFRDFESPDDQLIEADATVLFVDGPVFYTRGLGRAVIRIIVNAREKVVSEKFLSYDEVVALAFPTPNQDQVMYTVTFKHGCGNQSQGSLVKGEDVRVKNGMIFNVTATDKS